MITQANIWAAQKDRANQNIFDTGDFGVPINGSSGSGVGVLGFGSTYTDYSTGSRYLQVGTLASPAWSQTDGFSTLQQLSGTITSANITGTSAGQLGHANGVILIPAQGAHVVVELVSVVAFFKFNTAAYTGGGNMTVNNGAGGTALTGLVSAANSLNNAASKSVYFVPLSTVSIPFVENGPINLVTAAAPTQPGTAAGIITWFANFRVYNTGF